MNDFRSAPDDAYSKIGNEIAEAKQKFQQASESLKGSLQSQVSSLSGEAKRLLTVAALSAGVAVTAAIIYSLTTPKRRKQNAKVVNPDEPGYHTLYAEAFNQHPIITSIKTSIITFLLSIARDKVIDFIEKMNEKHEGQKADSGTAAKEETNP